MIKIDYEINSDEGVEIVPMHPPEYIKEIDGNIVILEGPGSSGKSTLLNMITFGCFGDKNPSLSESIKLGIEDLKSDYRKMSFDMEFSDPVSGTSLRLKRDNGGAVEVYENGSQRCLTLREFDSKYNLIYDIPDDPTKRLKEIAKTIQGENRSVSEKVETVSDKAKDLRNSIRDVLSPEKIEEIERSIETRISENSKLEEEKRGIQDKVTLCKQGILYHQYNNAKKKLETVEGQLKAERNKPERPKSSTEVKSEALKAWKKKAEEVRISPSLHNSIVSTKNDSLIDLLRQAEEVWDDVDLADVGSSRAFVQNITGALDRLKGEVPDKDANTDSIRAVNDILEILSRYQATVSLGEVGSIEELRHHLEKFKKENNLVDYSQIRSDVTRLSNATRSLSLSLDRYEKAGDPPNVQCRNESLVSSLTASKRDLESQITKLKSSLASNNLSVQKLEADFQWICITLNGTYRIQEDELKRMESDFEDQIGNMDKTIRDNNNFIETNEKRVEQYKNQPFPKFYGCADELGQIMDACRSIRSSIKNSGEKISKILNNDSSDYEKNKQSYDPIWGYLGQRLKTVTHMGHVYEVASVNLFDGIRGTIITKEGRVIRISSMGTGEGQQSYLKGLLSVTDDRKVIALFDEIGNMSESILKGVVDDLERLQRDGKLMLGLMVKPNDSPEVRIFGVQ